MLQVKIGCIKINYVHGVASVNVGTTINLQNSSLSEKPKKEPDDDSKTLIPGVPIPQINSDYLQNPSEH